MKRITCPACKTEVLTDPDGLLLAHSNSRTECPGSKLHWKVASASISAHLPIGQMVRVSHPNGMLAIITRQDEDGTWVHVGHDMPAYNLRSTKLYPVEISQGSRMGWEMVSGLRNARFNSDELTRIKTELEAQNRGTIYINGEIWTRPYGDRFVENSASISSEGWLASYRPSAHSNVDILVMLCQALFGEPIGLPDSALYRVTEALDAGNKDRALELIKGALEDPMPLRPENRARLLHQIQRLKEIRAQIEDGGWDHIDSWSEGEDSFDEDPVPIAPSAEIETAIEHVKILSLEDLMAMTDKALADMKAHPLLQPDTRINITSKGRRALRDDDLEMSEAHQEDHDEIDESEEISLIESNALLMDALRKSPSPILVKEAINRANGHNETTLEPNAHGAYIDDRRKHIHHTRWMRVEQGTWLVGSQADYYPELTTIYSEDEMPTDGSFEVHTKIEGWGAYTLTGDIYQTYGASSNKDEAIHLADLHLINYHYVDSGRPLPYQGLQQCWAIIALNEDNELETAIVPFGITQDKDEALDLADLPDAVCVSYALHLIEPSNGYYLGYTSAQGASNYLLNMVEAESIEH